jgi:hypothetical protein
MFTRRWWFPVVSALLLLPACMPDTGKDNTMPGTALGTYAVKGTLTNSTCGPSAFGSSDTWNFEVRLSREDSKLYWCNGSDVVTGAIAADGKSFTFTTSTSGKLTEGTKAVKGCTMTRSDSLVGTLSGTGDEIAGFSGAMTYKFGQTADSDCTDAVAAEGVVAFPCEMTYALVAAKQ